MIYDLFKFFPGILLLISLFLLSVITIINKRKAQDEDLINMTLSLGMSFLFTLSSINLFLSFREKNVHLDLLKWYHIGHHSFSFSLKNNTENALFSFVFTGIIMVIGFFSKTYLHREKKFFYFFFLYLVFYTSLTLVVFSNNIDTLFVGWELIGIASVLLIGFYDTRERSVKNAFLTLSYYRVGEIFLLAALTILHLELKETSFSHLNTHIVPSSILTMLIIAAFIKSSQFPFSLWLPRAMEGPTPSSAVFYGGISTHLGPLLLLKIYPLIEQNTFALLFLLTFGGISTLYASSRGRVTSDIKTQLAYATMAQLGVIYIEIGLGFYRLAIFHALSHCVLRTFQFLKSPSILSDFQKFPKKEESFYMEQFFSDFIRSHLYVLIKSKYYIEHVISWFVLKPFNKACLFCYESEVRILNKELKYIKQKAKKDSTKRGFYYVKP